MELNIKGTVIYEGNEYKPDYMNHLVDGIMYRMLSDDNLKQQHIVGIAMKRSPLLVAVFFAMLKLHIPFMPIDIDWPTKRCENLTKAVGVQWVIVDDMGEALVNKIEDIRILKLEEIKLINCGKEYCKMTSFDNELAYLICTSGTTGTPKAVEIFRKGLDNFLIGFSKRIEFLEGNSIICMANFSFDIIFVEIVLALSCGLHVILANELEKNNPRKIVNLMTSYQIDMVQMTPSRLKQIQFIDPLLICLKDVKILMLGGEKLHKGLVQQLKERLSARIFNLYGPTETTVWTTISELTNKEEVNVGTPIEREHICILDNELSPVENGEIGEICITGPGVGGGYRNNAQQEELHFVNLPYGCGERAYRTGDLGKFNADGDLICLGRIDTQIKFNGHRIELEEIEWFLNQKQEITQAVACFDEDQNRIIVFYIAEQILSVDVLIEYLSSVLPDYMVPSKYIMLQEFCYSHNGKMDRNAMLKKVDKLLRENNNEDDITWEGCSEVCFVVKNIVRELLQDENMNYRPNEKLHDVGLTSLLIVQMITEMEEHYGIETKDDLLVQALKMDFKEFCNYIERVKGGIE